MLGRYHISALVDSTLHLLLNLLNNPPRPPHNHTKNFHISSNHTSCCDCAPLPNRYGRQNSHVRANPAVVADGYGEHLLFPVTSRLNGCLVGGSYDGDAWAEEDAVADKDERAVEEGYTVGVNRDEGSVGRMVCQSIGSLEEWVYWWGWLYRNRRSYGVEIGLKFGIGRKQIPDKAS